MTQFRGLLALHDRTDHNVPLKWFSRHNLTALNLSSSLTQKGDNFIAKDGYKDLANLDHAAFALWNYVVSSLQVCPWDHSPLSMATPVWEAYFFNRESLHYSEILSYFQMWNMRRSSKATSQDPAPDYDDCKRLLRDAIEERQLSLIKWTGEPDKVMNDAGNIEPSSSESSSLSESSADEFDVEMELSESSADEFDVEMDDNDDTVTIKVQPETPAVTVNNNEARIKARKEFNQLCKAYNSGSCDREDPANPGICKINNAILIHKCNFRSNGEICGKNHARINHHQ